jgi:hypothetical protein
MADDRETTVRTITWQLAVAFGQGTGVMLPTGDALRTLYGAYEKALDRAADDWQAYAFSTIEHCRVIGQIASVHAAHRQSCLIEPQDVAFALEAAQRKESLAGVGLVCHMTALLR